MSVDIQVTARIRHWTDGYRDLEPGFGAVFQSEIDRVYKEAVARAQGANWYGATQELNRRVAADTIYIPNGYYWIDRTIVLPPCLSLEGAGFNTVLRFETAPNDFVTKAGTGWFRDFQAWNKGQPWTGAAACFLGMGADVAQGIVSQRRRLSAFTVETRGQAVGFLFFGRQLDLHVHECHLHCYGNKDSCGLVLADLVEHPDGRADNPRTGGGSFPAGYGYALTLPEGKPYVQSGWTTNCMITDCMVEGAELGMHLVGNPMTIADNHFWDCKTGLKVASKYSVASIHDNIFQRCGAPMDLEAEAMYLSVQKPGWVGLL